jgi:Carboxypeptidase regulatory-like domain/TonB dependent receptor
MTAAKLTLRTILFLFCLAVCVSTVHAQFKASIQGTVLDPEGNAIAGCKVQVVEQSTGLTRETVTSDQGFYRIAELPPGKYTVTVEATGFNKSVSKDVAVEAEQPRGFDVALVVGAVTQEVTVFASEEALQTENANTGTTVSSDEIARLPQVGRDPYELLRFTPGVFGDGSRTGNGQANNLPNSSGPGGSVTSIFQIENQVQVVANGQRTASNNFTIDGVSVNSLAFGGAAVITPNQESVQEITILSNSYSAEDGRGTGAQVKVVSKSGTNQFHGNGFFKYQDPNWNAFNKYHGPTGQVPSRVNNNFRQFGASLGGPVWKDKLLFFFSYEGLRSHNRDVSQGTWVETADFRQRVAAARSGSVAAAILTSPGVEPRIANVISTATCADAGITDPTRCRAVSGGLDIGSPTGAAGQYVPLDGAHFAGGGLDGNPDIQFVQLALPSSVSGNQYNWRLDYYLGRNQFAFSTYLTKLNNTDSDAAGRSRQQGDLSKKPQNQTEAISWIRTLSNTLVNEARLNFTRFAFNQVTANSDVNFGIPRVEIEGYNFDRIRFGADRSEATPAVLTENTINFRDIVSKVYRTHALRMGFELSAEQDNNNLLGGARPIYSNVRLWNFANSTPIFEGINADPRTGGPANGQRYLRSKAIAPFFQDDWKVKPNLTLNLGLRYEYYPPLSDTKHQLSNITFGSSGLLNSSVGIVSSLIKPDRNNFGPRIGFAWSPSRVSNSVVRGGFGVAYNRTDDVLFGNARGNPPAFARFNLCCGTSTSDFSTPFDGGAILYTLGSSNSATSYPVNPALAFGIDPKNGGVCGNKACTSDQAVEIYGGSPNYRNSYVYFYSLETEHRLRWGLIGTAGYQGSIGHKLTRLVNQNFLQQPNPAFFAVYIPTSDVNSNYNALNTRLRRQFSHGFMFDFNYRYSKSIDQLSNEGPGAQTNQTDPAHPQTEHGPSDFDAKHNFSAVSLWDIPFLRDRNDWIGRVAGGWQINAVLSAHTGFPWTPTTCIIQSVPITNAFNICPTRPTALLAKSGGDTSNDAFIQPDFNFSGIVHSGNCNASNGPIGGLPYFDICHPGTPGIGRNSFRGPNYFGLDFSIQKQFAFPSIKGLGEGAKLELRGNFFNVFNKLNLQPISFNTDQNRIENPRFGQSPGGLAGRVIEFQARFSF